jgi:hypothetical protein
MKPKTKSNSRKAASPHTYRRPNPNMQKLLGVPAKALVTDFAAAAVGGFGAGVLEEVYDRYVAPSIGVNPMLGNAVKAGSAAAVILLGHKLAQKNRKLPAREAAIGAVGGIAKGLYDELIGGGTSLTAAQPTVANGWYDDDDDDDDYLDVLDDDVPPMAAIANENAHMLGAGYGGGNAHMLGMAGAGIGALT